MTLGLNLWLQQCPKPEEGKGPDELCPEYDRGTADASAPAIRIFLVIKIILGVPLDILCFKYRWFAKSLLWFEIFTVLPYFMVPSKTSLETSSFVLFFFFV